nr:NADH-quinone oxidoreductase subunit N [Myxococcales bacterium]
FLLAGALCAVGSLSEQARRFTRRQGEFWLMLLCSVLGMSLLAGVRDLVLLVVSFELMGVPLYVMAAWARDDRLAVEGALKLFILGAVSSVTLMLGISLLTGLSNGTAIHTVATYAAENPNPALLLGAALTLGGMGFKLGVFPFHMWVPDTYQGSSTPFVAFLSVAPKAAALAALVRLLFDGGNALLESVSPMIITLAAATLVMGNLFALHQTHVKRLLGYSGVAHMGFLLMALATGTQLGLAMMLFYLLAYLFTNVGAFLVLHAVQGDGTDELEHLNGLHARSGWLSMAMLLFLLSLAGIPFVAGFWAKMYVFVAAWAANMQWLVILGALLSVLALFYYLRVVVAIFMRPPATDAEPVVVDWGTNAAIGLCLLMILIMGVMPGPFVEASSTAAAGFETAQSSTPADDGEATEAAQPAP